MASSSVPPQSSSPLVDLAVDLEFSATAGHAGKPTPADKEKTPAETGVLCLNGGGRQKD